MFDEPIITHEQAKKFYKAMGCSQLHMMRDYPVRYREYLKLGISQATERAWTKEEYEEYFANITGAKDAGSLWLLHSRMYDLFCSLRTHEALEMMLEVTRFIRDKVPLKDRIMVSETINGRTARKVREGLIYNSYDMGDISAAKAFTELSLYFAEYDPVENRGFERCRKATKLCIDIKSELGL